MRILAMLVLLLAYLPISQKAFAENELIIMQQTVGGTASDAAPLAAVVIGIDTATGQETTLLNFNITHPTAAGDSFTNEKTGQYFLGNGGGKYTIYDVKTNTVSVESYSQAVKALPWGGDSIISATNDDAEIKIDETNNTVNIDNAAISDGDGKNIIGVKNDGAVHIGENSLVTKEENGKQSLSAQDANGDAIDINITNGSNLLINGKPITAGVSIKEVRKYDSRSVALSAALTSLPTQSIDGSHACGIGSGVRGNYSAMALGCAADLDRIKLFDNAPLFIRNASINLGTSFLTHDDPDYTFKAGLTWNFGKSKAKTRNLSKNDRRDIRSTIAEQKNALAINKLQKDNRVLKESNMELTRKLNSLIAANQRFLDLSEKMERLAQQIEAQDALLAIK